VKRKIVKKLQNQKSYSKTKKTRKLKRNLEKSKASALLVAANLRAQDATGSNNYAAEADGTFRTSIPGTVDDFNLFVL
jgi:hypothetical protein